MPCMPCTLNEKEWNDNNLLDLCERRCFNVDSRHCRTFQHAVITIIIFTMNANGFACRLGTANRSHAQLHKFTELNGCQFIDFVALTSCYMHVAWHSIVCVWCSHTILFSLVSIFSFNYVRMCPFCIHLPTVWIYAFYFIGQMFASSCIIIYNIINGYVLRLLIHWFNTFVGNKMDCLMSII